MHEASASPFRDLSFAAWGRVLPTLLLAILLCGPRTIFAQATGQVSGVITDPGGQVVPGIKVELTNVATAEARSATTNGEGILSLPPGESGNLSGKGNRNRIQDDVGG